jgi:hypothetical protein
MVCVELIPNKGFEKYFPDPHFFVCKKVEIKEGWITFHEVNYNIGDRRSVDYKYVKIIID